MVDRCLVYEEIHEKHFRDTTSSRLQLDCPFHYINLGPSQSIQLYLR